MKQDIPDEFEVEDSENYQGGSGGTIKEIAMRAFDRCLNEGSKEMIPGGVGYKFIGGVERQVIIPNQREIFINTIRSFEVIMKPYYDNHDDIEEKIKESDKNIKNAKEEYNHQMWLINNPKTGESFRAYSEETKDIQKHKQNETNLVFGTEYEMYVVYLYRERLDILGELLKNLNHFDEAGVGT